MIDKIKKDMIKEVIVSFKKNVIIEEVYDLYSLRYAIEAEFYRLFGVEDIDGYNYEEIKKQLLPIPLVADAKFGYTIGKEGKLIYRDIKNIPFTIEDLVKKESGGYYQVWDVFYEALYKELKKQGIDEGEVYIDDEEILNVEFKDK